MGFKALGLGERDRFGSQHAHGRGIERKQGRALHEIQDRETRGKARGTRGRQHMVGAGDVIAHCFRRLGSQENRAGMARLGEQRLGIVWLRSPDVRARSGRQEPGRLPVSPPR